MGCENNSETNDIYLIPENYEGYVYAFYNVKGAPKIKQEGGGYDIYVINDEGYYATSTPDMDYGTLTNRYYYVDKQGRRTAIDEKCIRGIGTGGFENDSGININYTGIEVKKEGCSPEFSHSANGMDNEDSDSILKN